MMQRNYSPLIDFTAKEGNKGYFVKISNVGDMEHLKVESDSD